MCLQILYLINMYKEDLALNNLQWFDNGEFYPLAEMQSVYSTVPAENGKRNNCMNNTSDKPVRLHTK